MKKIPQTPEELSEELRTQLRFLERSAHAFDKGDHAEAKRLALSLRLLLHDTGNSTSLLEQLGKKGTTQFLDTSWKPTVEPDKQAAEALGFGLVQARLAIGGPCEAVPRLDASAYPVRYLDFDQWWTSPVLRDDAGTFSRCNLVLSVADQDGGAHVDPALDVKYHRLARQNSVGWSSDAGRVHRVVEGSIRQIAHEVLRSLKLDYQPSVVAPQHPAVVIDAVWMEIPLPPEK